MANSALENAKAKRKQLIEHRDFLQEEISTVRKKLDAIDKFIHTHEIFENSPEDWDVESENKKRTHKDSNQPRVSNSSKEAVAEVTRRLIGTLGEPIPRRELLKMLLDNGLTIEGSDQDKVLLRS